MGGGLGTYDERGDGAGAGACADFGDGAAGSDDGDSGAAVVRSCSRHAAGRDVTRCPAGPR